MNISRTHATPTSAPLLTEHSLSFYINFVILLQAYFIILSIVVNFFSGFAYVLSWKSQNLAGKAFAHMLLSRACHLVIYGVIDLGIRADWPETAPSLCIFTGFIHHLVWTSEYSWLLTVNFDFWRRFSTLRIRRNTGRSSKYLKYSLFAWGTPLTIVTASVIIYYTIKQKHGIVVRYLPDFGSCSVGRSGLMIYVIPLISAFVLASFCFALMTLYTLRKHRNDTASARLAKDKQDDISNFHLFWKLLILMGINWKIEFIIGVILFATFDRENRAPNSHAHLAYSLGALVLLIYMFISAVTISIMFVFKNKQVIMQLNRTFSGMSERIQRFFYITRRKDYENYSNSNSDQNYTDELRQSGSSSL